MLIVPLVSGIIYLKLDFIQLSALAFGPLNLRIFSLYATGFSERQTKPETDQEDSCSPY